MYLCAFLQCLLNFAPSFAVLLTSSLHLSFINIPRSTCNSLTVFPHKPPCLIRSHIEVRLPSPATARRKFSIISECTFFLETRMYSLVYLAAARVARCNVTQHLLLRVNSVKSTSLLSSLSLYLLFDVPAPLARAPAFRPALH